MSSSQNFSFLQILCKKMGDELANLLELFNSFKKAGRSATLTMSTKGNKATTVKLEVELNDAKPTPSSTTTAPPPIASLPPLPPGDRLRPRRSAAKRAKANARAAQHRAFQALPFPGGDYSAALGSLQPSPPGESLHIHPSPTDKSRRQILTVNRKAGSLPSFSQLDGDGDPPTATPHDPYGWPSNSTPCSENVKCSLCWDLPEHLRVPNVLYMVHDPLYWKDPSIPKIHRQS